MPGGTIKCNLIANVVLFFQRGIESLPDTPYPPLREEGFNLFYGVK
jgi:hypothetical protein